MPATGALTMMVTLETDRLFLRMFVEDDLDAYAAICTDPEVMRYHGDGKALSLIRPANLASIRVAERLGEILESRTTLLGQEALVYGVDRARWTALGRR